MFVEISLGIQLYDHCSFYLLVYFFTPHKVYYILYCQYIVVQHMREVLTNCNYPSLVLHKNFQQNKSDNTMNNSKNKSIRKSNTYDGYIARLYVEGLCKSIEDICCNFGMNTYFRGKRKIMNILVSPKDKDPVQCKSDVRY